MKSKLLAVIGLLLAPLHAAPLLPVDLAAGVNTIDLNHDGLEDLVMLAQYDDNTTHPSMGIAFLIARPEGDYALAPVVNNDNFIMFDSSLSATADKTIDYRLYRLGPVYYLISAHKLGDDLFDTQPVLFSIHQLEEARNDPGFPRYSWQLKRKFISTRCYGSVDKSFVEIDHAALSK